MNATREKRTMVRKVLLHLWWAAVALRIIFPQVGEAPPELEPVLTWVGAFGTNAFVSPERRRRIDEGKVRSRGRHCASLWHSLGSSPRRLSWVLPLGGDGGDGLG